MTMSLRELTLRYSTVDADDGHSPLVGQAIARAADAAPTLVSLLQHEAVEVFVVLCLSTKRRVLGYSEVSRGTLDATLVHPRDVFKVAVLANAAAIIAAHSVPGHRMGVMYPESLCAGVGADPLAPVGHRSRKGT